MMRRDALLHRRAFHYDVNQHWHFRSPAQHLLETIKHQYECESSLWYEVTDTDAQRQTSCWHARGGNMPYSVWIPSAFLTATHATTSTRPLPPPLASVRWLMNAAFVEDSDLFVFLLSHPLGTPQQSTQPWQVASDLTMDTPVIVALDGVWEPVEPGSVTACWLRHGKHRVQLQLDDAIPAGTAKTTLSHRPRAHGTPPSSVEDTYLLSNIVPPARAGARGTRRSPFKADVCWIDQATISRYRLACFPDAFYVPCVAAPNWQAPRDPMHAPQGRFFCNMDFADPSVR